MNGYIKNGIQLKEVATPATPSTSIVKVYAKTDGIYYIDDTGTETKLSGGGGIDEHQFPLNSFLMSGAILTGVIYTGSAMFPAIALDTASSSTAMSPLWKPTQPFIDAIAAGKKVFVEMAVSSVATGATDVRGLLNFWDDSAQSWSTEFELKTVTISTTEDIHYITYEFGATPALGDMLSFEMFRQVAGTLAGSLSVSNVRIYADTGAGS